LDAGRGALSWRDPNRGLVSRQSVCLAGSDHIHGETSAARAHWAKQQLDALWEGRLDEVLEALAQQAGDAGAVDAAVSYYTTHRSRLDYPSYRARNLQLGSGTIESTCKHLISARLKQAGMIWSEEGANAVSAVRAWLKSGRWQEAMVLRPQPRRSYQRERRGGETKTEAQLGGASGTVTEVAAQRQAAGLPSEVLE
jgi:hypothetical protein